MNFLFRKTKTDAPRKGDAVGKIYARAHLLTDTGPVRSHNEDYITVTYPGGDGQGLVAVLADGMGGHNAGEVASKMACKIITEHVLQHHEQENPSVVLNNALQHAHKMIKQAGSENAEQAGMGTTAVAVIIKDGLLSFGHVGDSRLYRYNNGTNEQLTNDQTLVNAMYDKGEITKEERNEHPMRNVLLQALGTVIEITPQLSATAIPLNITDKYLLCSDGVYDVFAETELQAFMRMDDPSFILECMLCVATERRASDNFSAIIISFSPQPVSVSPVTREQNAIL